MDPGQSQSEDSPAELLVGFGIGVDDVKVDGAGAHGVDEVDDGQRRLVDLILKVPDRHAAAALLNIFHIRSRTIV